MTRLMVRMRRWWTRRWSAVTSAGRQAGMSTAEYAVGTLAAVAFAVVLIGVVKSGAVKTALTSIIQHALSVAS
ncbi:MULTISPECIES: DUF4244 domain-containing protein [unclassified Allobranchiibius]|uniref:DUF4244 domain-containing protein n=1 Tax=unclassified Allobranchiibius TaxID=2649857 RepID=UPI001AA1347E|nr:MULTISPECIES: DUF4244 domain-containing protein [unclassified Allobranchiibius]MBO1766128.1 DUF4244 domain-containing protein [Allobranchiibius sp. GilTou38]